MNRILYDIKIYSIPFFRSSFPARESTLTFPVYLAAQKMLAIFGYVTPFDGFHNDVLFLIVLIDINCWNHYVSLSFELIFTFNEIMIIDLLLKMFWYAKDCLREASLLMLALTVQVVYVYAMCF